MSQRTLAEILGAKEQSLAKWEKGRDRPVANKSAERLLRLAYINYLDGKPEFSSVIDRITLLDAEIAEAELRLMKEDGDGRWLPHAA